jgi:hypothetical protein
MWEDRTTARYQLERQHRVRSCSSAAWKDRCNVAKPHTEQELPEACEGSRNIQFLDRLKRLVNVPWVADFKITMLTNLEVHGFLHLSSQNMKHAVGFTPVLYASECCQRIFRDAFYLHNMQHVGGREGQNYMMVFVPLRVFPMW